MRLWLEWKCCLKRSEPRLLEVGCASPLHTSLLPAHAPTPPNNVTCIPHRHTLPCLHPCLQGVTGFRAKISEDNAASLALFGGKLGYREVGRSAVFKEVTLELMAGDEGWQVVQDLAGSLTVTSYD